MAKRDPWRAELEVERSMKNEFMARHPESPFVAARVPFHDLVYFPPDRTFRVRATLDRAPTPTEAFLRTNRDNQAVMRYLGDLRFRLESRALKLRVYHAGEGVGTAVFVPFRDTTSGRESYGPGRYVTLELNEADEYDLDFNRAFNPYCAYTEEYECSFPPAENDLPVPVRAGEKVWAEDRNPRTPSSLVLARRPGRARSSKGPPSRRAGSGPKRSRGGGRPPGAR